MEHPAYLIIGSHENAKAKAYDVLMQALCKQKGCDVCLSCVQIKENRHHNVRWLVPDGQYKIDQLSAIFDTICFALDEGEHFFFVLERADLLNTTASNSLLKSLEEPPAGYHFILLAPWQEGILPTIISRCVTLQAGGDQQNHHALLRYFIQTKPNMAEFAKEVDKLKPSDKEVYELFDALYQHFSLKYKAALMSGADVSSVQKIIHKLDFIRAYPAMPGSGKIFLKNLFLQCFIG